MDQSNSMSTVDRMVRFSRLCLCFCLATIIPLARSLAAATNNPIRWEAEIAAFASADRTHPPPRNAVLFVGSSSIRLWKTLAQDFPGTPVINRGFGGSQISDSVYYADRIVRPFSPRLIVFYAGGNDLNAGKTPDEVFRDYQTFVTNVHAALPQTRIAFVSTAPNPARWRLVNQMKQLNELVEQYTRKNPQTIFIDVFHRMLGPDGQPLPDIYVADKLHLNAQGYRLWTEIIRPRVEAEMKRRP
jgi:lysophospholipase L1-like esterase